ncbi:flavin reductase family protein [Streptococcus troglodytae]|uniref:Acetyltransferase n=1 Tax=Streptococcus troglodytae TaxID=1111760 RepID=A0A1L7LHH6_9STRE|nr:flavin reductase family protein [Streptococcus troglodytae]BAQ23626.1 acetyltransferase [Streptococcus troglodytae]
MKQSFQTSKLYYGFPVFILGYKDENFGYNVTTCSSSYSLGDQIVIGIVANENAAEQIPKFGEFTVNIPHKDGMVQAERAGFVTHREKLARFHFEYSLSEKVDAPVLDCCPLILECKVNRVVEDDGICHIFATIVGRLIEQDLLDDKGNLDNQKLSPIYFMGDGHERVYRYLNEQVDPIGSFMKKVRKKDE